MQKLLIINACLIYFTLLALLTVEDAKRYAIKLRQKSLIASDITDATTSMAVAATFWSNPTSPFIPSSNGVNGNDVNSIESDPTMTILTRDDVILAQKGLPPQQYDAFVLFADADIEQAAEIQTKFEENEKYNFKVCGKLKQSIIYKAS